jgi:hypothetical protein
MNRSKTIILLGAILLITGCTDFFMICSLNPFFLDRDITLAPDVEGRWQAREVLGKSGKKDHEVWNQMDTTAIWKIERHIAKETIKTAKGKDSVTYKVMNDYSVRMINDKHDSAVYLFKMVIFKVKAKLYADFMPVENSGLEKSRFAHESYFKVHTLARINWHDGKLHFSWLSAESMKDMIEKKRVRVSYRWVSEAGRLLLTGSSEELSGMIERYAGEPRFIDWDNQPAMLLLNHIN